MKTLPILLFSLLCSNIFPQEIPEKEIKSEVNEVTVFLDGAQVIRKKTVDLTKGISIVRFVKLSPFIDAKSIQVKADGDITVLAVNHQQNYMDEMKKSEEYTNLEKQLKSIDDKLKIEQTYLSIIREELAFLQENRDIGGRNDQVSVPNLQQASEFYSKQLTALKMKEIERNETVRELNEQRFNIQNQINTISRKKNYPAGEILVKLDAKQTNTFALELSYLVGNAGWFPSYDIRAKNINEPVQIIYKANVKQDTKADWTNVKLKFSSADPNVSGLAPELQTYYLNYNTLPPSYKLTSNSVRGKVMDNMGQSLAGVNVVVHGTTIGTVTDYNGNYSITIPNNSSQLTFSYIGFNSQTQQIYGDVLDVVLEESMVSLDEVVVNGYGVRKSESTMMNVSMAGVVQDKSNIKIRGTNSIAIPTAQIENQTSVDFEIETPYSIKSDNKNYMVDMAYYDLPAFYQYFCVPKIDKDAFLIANIIDWEQYNLLEGEANIFFEDTYVGKTLMDVRFATDTLQISLGRDKQVSVNREKIKDFTDKQFIGNKKVESRAWKTTVKNNKSQEINMILLDQVPVSTIEEIEVNVQNISGAQHNLETGEIKWEFKLEPNDKKEFDLNYSVKFPKNRTLPVE